MLEDIVVSWLDSLPGTAGERSRGVGQREVPSASQPDHYVLAMLPAAVMRRYHVMPVACIDGTLTLGMVNPQDRVALAAVKSLLGDWQVAPVQVSQAQIEQCLAGTPWDSKPPQTGRTRLKSVMRGVMSRMTSGPLPKTPVAVAREGVPPVAAKRALLGVATDRMDSAGGRSLSVGPEAAAVAMAPEVVREVEPLKAPPETLQEMLAKQEFQYQAMPAPESATLSLAAPANEPPVVRLVNGILSQAIGRQVSDIHIEPREHDLALRFRIDGVMHLEQLLPKQVQLPLTSRFKIMANLDIAERRLPQDGRISLRLEGKPVDIRISTMPTKYGEKLCMRILDKSNATLELGRLVQHPQVLAGIQEMLRQPYGIVFVTGPTGSGKTTTLYSGLAELNTPDVSIMTVEDPIEYDLHGINQVQVNKEIGLDFARVLRGLLRQDPDVILVGETRDRETAKTAVEAALTGHMVFTSLHTNSAAGSFVRLQELGVEAFLTASATVGIIAQRLVRRICSACRETYTPDEEVLNYLGWPYDAPATFYRGAGCAQCNGTGYKGRVGIYEVLRINAELRKLIIAGASTPEIHAKAVEQGMLDLKGYAHYLIQQGETTVEEVLTAVAVSD